MKKNALIKRLTKFHGDPEIWIVLASGKAFLLKEEHIKSIAASPRPHDESGQQLVRSKRAKRRVVISVGVVDQVGSDDVPVVPTRLGIDL